MGGCQNYGPFLSTLNIRCRIITGAPIGTIILTTTHIYLYTYADLDAQGIAWSCAGLRLWDFRSATSGGGFRFRV